MGKGFDKSMSFNSSWTKEWPKKAGRYWFYGILSSVAEKPSLFVVVCWKTPDGYAYITDNMFMYSDERAKGIWKFLPEPNLPKNKDEMFK